jgi:hypothetical protein
MNEITELNELSDTGQVRVLNVVHEEIRRERRLAERRQVPCTCLRQTPPDHFHSRYCKRRIP